MPTAAAQSLVSFLMMRLKAHKVLSLVLFVSLISLWLGVGYHIMRDRSQTVENANAQVRNLTLAFAEHVAGTMSNIDSILKAIIRDYSRSPDSFNARHSITELSNLADATIQLTVIGADGYMLHNSLTGLSNNAEAAKLYLGDREHFRFHADRLSSGLYISKPIVGRVSGRQTIQFSRRIEENGRFSGVAVLSIAPSYLSNFFRRIDLGRQGVITVVGSDMFVRARATGDGDTTIGQDLNHSPLSDALRINAYGDFTSNVLGDGVDRFFYFITLPDFPLIVNVGLSREEALAPFRSRAMFTLSAALAVSIALALAIFFVLQQMWRQYRLAYEDRLTGLSNKAKFTERLEWLSVGGAFSVLLLDLDRFGAINFSLGYQIGDELLQKVATRLSNTVPTDCELFRLWGDEFAIICPNHDANAAATLATAIGEALARPLMVHDQKIDVFGRIGIGIWPKDSRDFDQLLQRTELAVRQAKRNFSVYEFASNSAGLLPPDQLYMLGELRNALANAELVLHFQPILDLNNCTIHGVEALVRWLHPQRGTIPPSAFVPFAEDTGFIREMTPWLIRQATHAAALWRAAGYPISVSVNVSAIDLSDENLEITIVKALEECQLPPEVICIEVTESALMADPQRALKIVNDLVKIGVQIAIDDYGSGQASLAYLKAFPAHILKIDKSLIDSVVESPKDSEIVRSTIALGHALGLQVVAEGIETEEQRAWLSTNGCDRAQGFVISRPMDETRLLNWLRERENAVATSPSNILNLSGYMRP